MKPASEKELSTLVKDWIRHNSPSIDSTTVEIAEDTDLIAEGLLDSIGFIELILFVESKIGCKIDLSDIDPSQFTTLEGFCKTLIGNGS